MQENTTVRQGMGLGTATSPPKRLDVQCGYISASQLHTHTAKSQCLLSVFG
uniref:Uncharacterized protein n=1 Tax=Anguilla anguilla TaxID=7936 RepID=A0A0E9W2N9_ANGAN